MIMKIWGFLGHFQWDLHNAMAMALWNFHITGAPIRMPSGKTVLDTQVLWSVPPEPSKARTSESLGQQCDHKLNRLSLVTGRTVEPCTLVVISLKLSDLPKKHGCSLLHCFTVWKKCSNGLIRSTQLQPSDSGARHVPLNLCSGVVHVPTKLCQAPPVRRCSSVQSCLKTWVSWVE
jgi:hypothetical protein